MSSVSSFDDLDSLRLDLSRRFQLQDESIDIQGHRLSIASVKDVDQVLDSYLSQDEQEEAIQDEQIPYWAEVWPSAIALGTYLLSKEYLTPESQVLEIGCGLGVPGIVAGKIAKKVVLTDYLSDPLLFAKYNWNRNHLVEADCRLMDWRAPSSSLASDIVLASDVAYEPRAFDPLLASIPVLLKPHGRLILSEPRRPIAQPFRSMLGQLDYQIHTAEIPVKYGQISATIHIFELIHS
ncbi:MAG: 50S ribosomal protein L11 methyltransferase [Bacteroidota bacterium]